MKLALVLFLTICIVTSSETEGNVGELSDKNDYNEEHQTGENHLREARGINIFFYKLYKNYKIIIFEGIFKHRKGGKGRGGKGRG
jgi:hypothetical protein